MRAGPGLAAVVADLAPVSWWPGSFSRRPVGYSWWTKPQHNILFKRFSAAFTKKVFKVCNINHIQLKHHSIAIALSHPSTRPRPIHADAGFRNHMQAGQVAWPPLARDIKMEAGPLRNTGRM